jgi:GAF domain-containing protein
MNLALREIHMSPIAVTTQAAFNTFKARLQAEGLRPALAYLLGLTDYRFIALFRFQGDRANAAVFYDREHPDVLRVDDVAANATYCCFARDARGVFATADAMRDPRLLSHVAREAVQAYWGVPVMTPEGDILGTLCHYDVAPRETRQIDLELMLAVASTIERQGLVPPYPAPIG